MTSGAHLTHSEKWIVREETMKRDYEKAFRGATPETLARALMQPAKRKPKPAPKGKAARTTATRKGDHYTG